MLLTIGPGGCGFSFLNWTISFLRGDTVYQTLDGIEHAVVPNPILGLTAHEYGQDHLRIENSKSNYDLATPHSIIYAVPGNQTDFEYLLTLPGKKIVFDTADHSKMLMARALVCVPKSANNLMALWTDLSRDHDPDLVMEVMLQCHRFFTQYYQLPTRSRWFFQVNYTDIFSHLDQTIVPLFAYLELEIDSARLRHWQHIYTQFKTLNQRDFCSELIPMTTEHSEQKTQIFKEILAWKNGSYQNT